MRNISAASVSTQSFIPGSAQALKDATKRLGDLDGSGKVDFDNLLKVSQNYGTDNASADINADGHVDGKDMSILKGYYGKDVGEIVRKEGLQSKRMGDLNGDKKIDFSDLVLVAQNFNSTNEQADINGDKKVDMSDLNILAGYYNQSVDKLEVPLSEKLQSLDQTVAVRLDTEELVKPEVSGEETKGGREIKAKVRRR